MLKLLLEELRQGAVKCLFGLIFMPLEKEKNEIKDFLANLGCTNLNLDEWDDRNILDKLLGLWLWKYEADSDLIRHWEIIYPPIDSAEDEKKKKIMQMLGKIRIRGGRSSAGVIAWSSTPIILNDTALDPRASASIEDYIIRDFSWVGIPVSDGKCVRLVISFFLPYLNAWKDKEKIVSRLTDFINGYREILILAAQNDTLSTEINNFPGLLKSLTASEDSILKTISTSKLISPSLIILFKNEKGKWHIPQPSFIHPDIREIEDILLRELQWCVGTCNSRNCPYKTNKENILPEIMSKWLGCGSINLKNVTGSGNNFEVIFYLKDNIKIQKGIIDLLNNILKINNVNNILKMDYKERKKILDWRKSVLNLLADIFFGKIKNDNELNEKLESWPPLVKIKIDDWIKLELKREEIRNLFNFYNNTGKKDISTNLVGIAYWDQKENILLKFKNEKIKCFKDNDLKGQNYEGFYLKHPGTFFVLMRVAKLIEKDKDSAENILKEYFPLISKMGVFEIRLISEKIKKIIVEGNENKYEFEIQKCGSNKNLFPQLIRLNYEIMKKYLWEYYVKKCSDINDCILEILNRENKNIEVSKTEILEEKFLDRISPPWKKFEKGLLISPDKEKIAFAFLDIDPKETKRPLERYINEVYEALKVRQHEFTEGVRATIAAIKSRNRAHILDSQVIVRFEKLGEEEFRLLKQYIITRSEYIANITGEVPLVWGGGYLYREDNGKKSGELIDFIKLGLHKKLLSDIRKSVEIRPKINNNLKNIRIGFPFGASIGRHGIYSILENYIRNIAKYGYVKDNILKISLSLKQEREKGYVWLKISSNSKISSQKSQYKEKADEINKYAESPLIQQSGERVRKGWGICEMKIDACLLAGEDINKLGDEGSCNFFIFDYDKAIKNGSYQFKLKIRKFEPYICLNNDELETFIKNPLAFPLCDFLVLDGKAVNKYYKIENWHLFPIGTAVIENDDNNNQLECSQLNEGEKWIRKRLISVKNNQALEINLWESFWHLLKDNGAIDYNIKFFIDNKTKEIKGKNDKKIAICHNDEKSKNDAMNENYNRIISLSRQKLMYIWWNELEQNKTKKIAELKWKILTGSKILLIDNRIYELYIKKIKDDKNFENETKNLNIIILPEDCQMIEKDDGIELKLKNQPEALRLGDFNFISIHLNYLETNPESSLCRENNLKRIPSFIFTHTMRGKVDKDFINKVWWFKKIISAGSILSLLDEDFALEIKINLLNIFLSPQQAAEVYK